MTTKSRSHKLILPIVAFVLMVSGCDKEDLSSVEKFGETSAVLQQTSTKMVQDIYDSCTRKEYVQIQYANALERAAPISIKPTVPTPIMSGVVLRNSGVSLARTLNSNSEETSEAPNFPPAKIRFKCRAEKDKAQVLQNLNDVLAIYVSTLGRLASRNTITFDQNLNAIRESFISFQKQAPGSSSSISENERKTFENGVNNGINISTSLLNLIADQQRHEKLKPIIVCNNDAVTKYIGDLQNQIKKYYITGVLQEEEEKNIQYIEEMYNVYLNNSANNKPESSINEYTALENDYNQRIEGIEARKTSAQAYINILGQTSITHQALAKTFRGDMTTADQNILCQNEGYLASDTVVSTQKSTLDLTPEQVQEAHQILSEYEVSIQPSLKVLKQTYR
ncbi:hypothetical protein [Pseudanabaena sp. BC1403]|uniref:hypothetical protein n=1 Tax=Pseudanabaena sp. BC1403 TaxID=2043171 RepID=UPI0011AF4FE3|nr:hypothetical protein [Pseudanabaena sp. BC1403]